MLSEDAIENLVKPLIDRLERINTYILKQIARRIYEIGKLSSSDIYKLQRLLKSGNDVRLINEELAKLTNLQVKDIKALIRNVALDNYIDVKPYYDYRQIPYLPFVKNKELQKVVIAIANETANTYKDLSKNKSIGFLIRDMKRPNKLKFYTIQDTYKTVIDEAIQMSQSGVVDYQSAMRRTIMQLNNSGIQRMVWESGYTQRLDTTVKRNLLDGVRAINQAVQDETGKQFGADGKEISVHAMSALDHEPVQGHQFTNEEYEKLQTQQPFEDINGNKFDSIKRPIGLWNCRHFAWNIIIGTKPRYTQKQLDTFIKNNHKGIVLSNGKHLTMYECTQVQRKMETKIRYLKESQMTALSANDRELAESYQAKINKRLLEYNAFSKLCGLQIKGQNIRVDGYKAIKL